MSREEEDQLEQVSDDEQANGVGESGDDAARETGDTSSLAVQDGDAASYDSQADTNDFAEAEDDTDEDDDDDDEEEDVVIHDADAEDAAEKLAEMRREMAQRTETGGAASGGTGAIEGEDAARGARGA